MQRSHHNQSFDTFWRITNCIAQYSQLSLNFQTISVSNPPSMQKPKTRKAKSASDTVFSHANYLPDSFSFSNSGESRSATNSLQSTQ